MNKTEQTYDSGIVFPENFGNSSNYSELVKYLGIGNSDLPVGVPKEFKEMKVYLEAISKGKIEKPVQLRPSAIEIEGLVTEESLINERIFNSSRPSQGLPPKKKVPITRESYFGVLK